MPLKNVIILFSILFLFSCSKKEVVQIIKNDDGSVQIINSGKEKLKKFTVELEKIGKITNLENDTSFVLTIGRRNLSLSVDLDSKQNIYTFNSSKGKIYKFDKTGKFIKLFGARGQGPGEFPRGIADLKLQNDTVFVFDNSGRLSLFDVDGKFLHFINVMGRGVKAEQILLSNQGVYYLGRVFEGNRRSSDFKMGYALFNAKNKYEINNKIYGELKPFDRKNIDPDDRIVFITTLSNIGNILVAKNSTNKYEINEYTYAGKLIKQIKKRYRRLKRSKEFLSEYDGILKEMEKQRHGRVAFQEPQKYKTSMSDIFVDYKNNIWVSVEESIYNEKVQIFDVFDADGAFLKRVEIPQFAGMKIFINGQFVIATTLSSEFKNKDAEIVFYKMKLD